MPRALPLLIAGLIGLAWQASAGPEKAVIDAQSAGAALPRASGEFRESSPLELGITAEVMASLAPSTWRYAYLRRGLLHYRALAEAGGWAPIPDGPTIGPGSNDSRIRALVARLAASGELTASERRYEVYDEALRAAVRRFQGRHGLAVDGLVGKKTLRALNVPVEQRIDQIRVNLERQRSWKRPAGGDYLLVNVPAFTAYVYQKDRLSWATKVIVGDIEDETPEFESKLTTVVFNPTWSVPYSIASEELLPEIRRDPAFLARGNYRVVDRDGGSVDPDSVDWSVIRRSTFPYTLVQQAGPGNELGQVKFLFPNRYSVCMHDTPGKALFERERRAFSHGCIRVDEPLRLAEVLLGRDGWTRADIDARLRSGHTSTVALEQPWPISLLYWTVDVAADGTLVFYDDLYGRDAAVLNTLIEPEGGATGP